jgi:hypothetical protein
MSEWFLEQITIKVHVKLGKNASGDEMQVTKFAMQTANIPMTQGSSPAEITNEDNACHFLQYQGYSSL